jgi:hypothetical protein
VRKPKPTKAEMLLREADTRKKRETLFMAKRRILRQMFKEGLCTEAETKEQYVALDVILRLIKDPLTRPELRFLAAKELWPHEAMTLAEEARVSAGDGAPMQITIQVAGWAAAKAVPALPAASPAVSRAPDETVIANAIIEPDMPRTNGSPPTPTLNDRERLRAQVLAQRETVVVEAPASPSEPARVIGRVSQGKPYELSADEKTRIMETLHKGKPAQ